MNAIQTYAHFTKYVIDSYYDMMKDVGCNSEFTNMKKSYVGSKKFKKNKRKQKVKK